ncbi:acyl-CoA dehydrogenase family protein [Dactylosporangium sp. NBC_01737]|uniref:acyl-CoA dehydrogenase family protein n=1 Tax=Dactylosporangium sp. NBC_01737 TaxID=2975959 RepID=UPI002E161C98|nr:acyl-CoA dehydrogenase family protein [Dactylosporangium sp. NBC_01737]
MTDQPSTMDAEHAALRDSVAAFFGTGAKWDRLTGELGLTALAIGEEHGGFGASLVELGIVLEEAGAALLTLPLLSTTVAALALDPALPDAAALLPALAAGDLVGTLALDGDCTARPDRDGYVLDGSFAHVLDADAAGVVLVSDGTALYAVTDPAVRPQPTLDQTRGQGTLVLWQTPGRLVSRDPAHARDLLHVALAAESVGVARASLRLTAEHLRTRSQFGVPLATFQALRHRVADLHVQLEQAVSSVWYALRAAGTPDFPTAAPLAKLIATEAAWTVTRASIQLLGGIGFTWEHDAHRYLKRATTNRLLADDPVTLRRLLLTRAGL